MSREVWPALSYEAWMPTKKTLHMCAQMIGKARLALARPSPNGSIRASFSHPRD